MKTGLSTSRVVLASLLVVLAASVTVPLLFAPRYLQRHQYAATKNGCNDIPPAAAFTPYPGTHLWPYGIVRSCRTLGKQTHLLGQIDFSFTLLLETDRGPVLTRMDYSNIHLGRQYVAKATELDPVDVDLPDPVATMIEKAIAERGGLQPVPWTVHYGDG